MSSPRSSIPGLFVALLLICAVPFTARLEAQETAEKAATEIRELIDLFVKRESFPNRREYYTGEMALHAARPHLGQVFHHPKYELDVRIVHQDESSAAVAVSVSDAKANQQSDYYLFMRRVDDRWKLAAVRTFQPPAGMGQLYAAIASKGKDVNQNDIRELMIMRSLQYNDWAMKEIFKQKREKFDQLVSDLQSSGVTEVIHGGQANSRIDPELWEQVRDSQFNFVQLQENGMVELNAAAFGETALGFFHAGPSLTPPLPSPDNYILVEHLDGPWYMYRRQ